MLGPTVGTFGTVLEHRVFQEHAAAYCLAVGTASFLLVRRATNPRRRAASAAVTLQASQQGEVWALCFQVLNTDI